MRHYLLIAAVFLGSATNVQGQVTEKLKDQVTKEDQAKQGHDASIVDPTYGITIYDNLNPMVEGDSTRISEKGYAAEGWITDKYESGQILHKGFYIEGQLKIYKNYYPDGTLEREFKALNTYTGQLKSYYPNGQMKSKVKYVDGASLIWSDFYENGQLEYYEEYHKSFAYHIAKRSYFEDGKPESLFEMTDKKKLHFSQNDFFSNGNKKLEGLLFYDKKIYDYRKIGTWKYFLENGQLDREEKQD